MNVKGGPVLYVSFNQDISCFSVGTQDGFFICDSVPLKLRFQRVFNYGIRIVEMLYKCNILALVGGGDMPLRPSNYIIIWDDSREKNIAELEFKSEIKAVKMRKDCIVVVLDSKIYVYNFNLNLIKQFDTNRATLGLVSLSSDFREISSEEGPKPILVFPSAESELKSAVIEDLNSSENRICLKDLVDSKLEYLILNNDGSKLVVSSQRGTQIRVYEKVDRFCNTKFFRRGSMAAKIYCVAFSHDSRLIALTSSRSTHIFDLEIAQNWRLTNTAIIILRDITLPSICAFYETDEVNTYILLFLSENCQYKRYKLKYCREKNLWKSEVEDESSFLFDNAISR